MPSLTPLLHPTPLFLSATFLRLTLFLYGLWQDANTPLKYTDIDYLVFTDAARFLLSSPSSSSLFGTPYARETYRYTPLLSWLLLPTALHPILLPTGKLLFSTADLLAGWFLLQILHRRNITGPRAGAYAAIWLLNPMVATISTRGSSEGILGVLTAGLLWAVGERRVVGAAILLGVGVHLKIYPFIYTPAIIWWMDTERITGKKDNKEKKLAEKVVGFVTIDRVKFAAISFSTFMTLNVVMYLIYGYPFILHTYLYHVNRLDHRHNFSPYNTLLYLTSASASQTTSAIPSFAFLPQLLLSALLLPLFLAKKSLPLSLLVSTFAFVTFNKVCTSQYFLWYMVFLPVCLPGSTFMERPWVGLAALAMWVLGQAAWLQQGFQLEFIGESTFLPGLWVASLGFFFVNCWILGIMVGDGRKMGREIDRVITKEKKKN